MQKCPGCGLEVDDGAVTCPGCGSALGAVAAAVSRSRLREVAAWVSGICFSLAIASVGAIYPRWLLFSPAEGIGNLPALYAILIKHVLVGSGCATLSFISGVLAVREHKYVLWWVVPLGVLMPWIIHCMVFLPVVLGGASQGM